MTSLFREEATSKQGTSAKAKLIKGTAFYWIYYLAFSLGAILLIYGLYYSRK